MATAAAAPSQACNQTDFLHEFQSFRSCDLESDWPHSQRRRHRPRAPSLVRDARAREGVPFGFVRPRPKVGSHYDHLDRRDDAAAY